MKNSIYERKEDFGKAEKPEDFLSAPFLHIPGDIPIDYIDMDKFYKYSLTAINDKKAELPLGNSAFALIYKLLNFFD